MKTKSIIPYFGSEAMRAMDLGALFNDSGCSHVTIPFVGGAAIISHLTARGIIANDLHEDAINFYRVVSGVHGRAMQQSLIERCGLVLSHPSELGYAREVLESMEDSRPLDRAWAFWVLCWLGRKGKAGTKFKGGGVSVRWTADGGNNASRIRAAAGDLCIWAEHFQRCEWLCSDFRVVLSKVKDIPKNGIYCDPPWVVAGKDYLHAFSEQDHRDLAEKLATFEQLTIVVRYGDDDLVRELYPEPEWAWMHEKSRTQTNKVRGEVWICRNVDKTEK